MNTCSLHRLVWLLVAVCATVQPVVGEDLAQWRQGRTLQRLNGDRTIVGVPDAMRERSRLQAETLAERTHQVHELIGPQHVSRRSQKRLATRGFGLRIMQDGSWDKAQDHVDTLRVLIVRIGFEADRSGDLTSVTTTGDFQLEPDSLAQIDPAPHDRDFYMSHLYGLSEYYRIQSGGRLQIMGRVLPEDPQGSYKLSDIADYGPGADNSWTIASLERLVQDMIAAADVGTQADGDVSLADFDDDDPLTYVIFVHAGADWQSDVYRDSPNDIPTFFVTLGEAVALTSIDQDTGQPGALTECSVVPETTTQDGFYGSIAGALYHEFGHALGLPDIYDTSTGLPTAGYWDLMDTGPNLFATVVMEDAVNPAELDTVVAAGLLPPSLSAWCRWYLGWLELDELGGDEREIHLPAVQVPREDYARWYRGSSAGGDPYDFSRLYPQALVAGAAPSEFFLLENRWVPLYGSDLPDVTGVGFVSDHETGVLLFMGGDPEFPGGPYRNTGMYDWFLPSGGLLVWHVDQERIIANLADNTINNGQRGLRLVEADGITDIGVYDFFTDGFLGSAQDPFHAGTQDHLDATGRPSSLAWDRSWTGVTLSEISENDATMTFRGRIYPLADDTPWSVAPYTERHDSLASRRLDVVTMTPWILDGEPVVVCASKGVDDPTNVDEEPWIFAWELDGTKACTTPVGASDGAAWSNGAEVVGPPVVVTQGDHELLMVATRDGNVTALPTSREYGAWIPDWSVTVGDTLLAGPVPIDTGGARVLACLVSPTTLRMLDPDGGAISNDLILEAGEVTPERAVRVPPLSVTRPQGGQALFAATRSGWYLYAEQMGLLGEDWAATSQATSLAKSAPLPTDPRLGFLPDGERTRVVAFAGQGGGWVVDLLADDVVVAEVPDRITGTIVGDPATADVDGDGRHDLVVVSDTHVHVFNTDLLPLRGWPVRLLSRFTLDDDVELDGGVAVFDGDGDGLNEVWVTTDDGNLVVLDARGELVDGTPFLWGDHGGAALVVDDAGDQGRMLWLVEPGGRTASGLGHDAVEGRLAAYLPPSASRNGGTSEWLAPGGSPRRLGPVGDPGTVAGSPLVEEIDKTLVYPNPWRQGEVHFRFWVATAGRARVTVYNLEGELVADLETEALAETVSEIAWTPTDLASGIYLCRFEVPGPDGRIVSVERLAVER